ncbi:hypothetical protein RCL1_005187 [Eukaryota sp. TZLM3-RCL]
MSELRDFLHKTALDIFLRLVTYDTQADATSKSVPSSTGQISFMNMLNDEFKSHGFDPYLSESYSLYIQLPATKGLESVQGISFLAHIDTSPESSGANVKPIIHKNYQGGPITYPNSNMVLTDHDEPALKNYIGRDLITSDGSTLLGADDKSGVACLYAVLLAIKKFNISHGPLSICFTCDEEIGRGTDHLDLTRLHSLAFTIDGGEEGTFEIECFDAWGCTINFEGIVTHPGSAHDKMINASLEMSRFVTQLFSSFRSPEHSHGRDGFVYITHLEGGCESSKLQLLLRSFSQEENAHVRSAIQALVNYYKEAKKGLQITLSFKHQYSNMYKHFQENGETIISMLKGAIARAGLIPRQEIIRGGTDGCRLCEMGILCANIFDGGHLFHSRREFCPVDGPGKAAETVIAIVDLIQSSDIVLPHPSDLLEGTGEIEEGVVCK